MANETDFSNIKLGADSSELLKAIENFKQLAKAGGMAEADVIKTARAIAIAAKEQAAAVKKIAAAVEEQTQRQAKASQLAANEAVKSASATVKAAKDKSDAVARSSKVSIDADASAIRAAKEATRIAKERSLQAQRAAREEAYVLRRTQKEIEAEARKRAAAAREAEVAEKRRLAASERQLRSLQALKASLDPLEAATQRYQNILKQLNVAVERQNITQAEANRLISLAAQHYRTAEEANNLFTMSTFRVSDMSRVARANIQQFAYQIQDVAIQLQAGQDALIIFAQQGSQIASLFGPYGALVGVVLSVAAALGTILVPSIMSGKTQAEKLSEASNALSKELAELKEASDIAGMSQTALAEKFGASGAQIQKTMKLVAEARRGQVMGQTRALVDSLFDGLAPEGELTIKCLLTCLVWTSGCILAPSR